MLENKTVNYRDDFPGYMGYIPYKKEVIGMTVGSTNGFIKQLLTTEPPKEEILRPLKCDDYSYYNKDYFTQTLSKNYNLEEDMIYSDKSKEAQTWINGSKYKIYPQHIPGYKAHVPGIYSSNIHGMGYSKSTAIAIKGDYIKTSDVSDDERFKSLNNLVYKKPQMRSHEDEEKLKQFDSIKIQPKFVDPSSLKKNTTTIYKSKISNVPTVGYAGHTSIFIKPISYLNKDKIERQEELDNMKVEDPNEGIPETFQKVLNMNPQESSELPYIVGYRGYRPHVRAKNHYGQNFRETSFITRHKK